MGDRFATKDMGRSLLRPCNKHTMVSYV